MHGSIKRLTAAVMSILIILSLAGCMGEDAFSLESTGTGTGESAASSEYVRTEFDTLKNPYFALLDEAEKDAYSIIYEELSAGNSKFKCKAGINADQLKRTVDAVLDDHPELFWIDNNYGYTFESGTGNVRELKFKFFDFADTPEKLKAAKADFNNATTAVVTEAYNYDTAVERELFIHDFICKNTTYDVSAPYNQSAYSALVLHKSVCAGYSRAFQHLMQQLGFSCYYVPGNTYGLDIQQDEGNPEDGSHSWNIVVIGGGYYNVDCLWDDSASDTFGRAVYPFFNVTDDALIHHERADMAVYLPRCFATEYSYNNQFGDTIDSDSLVFANSDEY